MENFKQGQLDITIVKNAKNILMSWQGISDSVNPSELLNPYLDNLLEQLHAYHLMIEFKKLEYMNSSTIPPIIRFLKKLNDHNITATIIYDNNSKWQAVSFKALKSISTMLPQITVEGR